MNPANPDASIVIPAHNRAGLTRACLEALLREAIATSFEVIVVDDASTDVTPTVLRDYGSRITVLSRESAGGFGRACNEGAAAAIGRYLIFLNNDTDPEPGWLDALVSYAEAHPEAAVVGSRLVYPNGTIQHAGVVIGCDGYPHHLYAGFPRDHPAVTKARSFQAVTAACALVRRSTFEEVGGFDTGFRNSLEDVDLCLRLGQLGHQVHYCPDSVVGHLESASRGHADRFAPSVSLYRERWRHRIRADDVSYYIEDGLLGFDYNDAYPARLSVAPQLAIIDGDRGAEIEHLLEAHSREVTNLLRELVRLTAHIADLELGWGGDGSPRSPASASENGDEQLGGDEFLKRIQKVELELNEIQVHLAAATDRASRRRITGERIPGFESSRYLDYRRVMRAMRQAVTETVPPGATVLVASRGDPELLDLEGRQARHFPQDATGGYAGYYPADSGAAIEHLEELRRKGAHYLVLPATALWWIDHYPEFGAHLADHYRRTESDACLIFSLDPARQHEDSISRRRP